MKANDVPRWGKRYFIITLLFVIIVGIYALRCSIIYESIDVKVTKNAKIEYGSANYKVEDLIDKISGDKINIVKDVNTSVVGKQKIILEVTKSNVTKEIPIKVEVVDSEAPEINVKEEVVYVNNGFSYDLNENIASVVDIVDGNLEYIANDKVNDKSRNYYTISDFDSNTDGEQEVEIKAVDKYGNISIKNFIVKVISNGKEKTISNIAYSLVGSPYVSGGNSPAGFDCSGFVQYVYACAGLKVSRSASTQLYDGYEVAYSNIRVGDIIVWGYGSDAITHTAIYVGNGLMIHAATPAEGVVVNQVAGWGAYSGVHIVSVRRMK